MTLGEYNRFLRLPDHQLGKGAEFHAVIDLSGIRFAELPGKGRTIA
jgi:hypothetical protein